MSKKNQCKGKKSIKCKNPNCESFSKKAKSYCDDHCSDLAAKGAFGTTELIASGTPTITYKCDSCKHNETCDLIIFDTDEANSCKDYRKYKEEKVKKEKKRNIEQTVELLEYIYLKVADHSDGGTGVCSIKREDMLMIVGRKKLKESRVSEIQSMLEEAKGLLLIDEDSTFYIMDLAALPTPYPVTADIIVDAMTQI